MSRKMDIYQNIKRLYKSAFPKEERAPFWLLMRKGADFWALYDGEKWVGIAHVVKNEELAYVFYLAICEKDRGKGYGRQAVEALKAHYQGGRLFLALERLDPNAENYEQRVKRHAFYQHCGLSDLPYQLKEASVVYDIMGVGGKVEPEEYRALMEGFMGKLWCRIVDVRIIK